MSGKRAAAPASAALLPAPRAGERTEPLDFVVESFSVHVRTSGKETSWAAEVTWDDEDGCFVLEDVHNFNLAPCDLLELARILRCIPRQLAPPPATRRAATDARE